MGERMSHELAKANVLEALHLHRPQWLTLCELVDHATFEDAYRREQVTEPIRSALAALMDLGTVEKEDVPGRGLRFRMKQ